MLGMLLGLVNNKYTIMGIVVIGLVIGAYIKGRVDCRIIVEKEVVKEVIRYVDRVQKVDKKYKQVFEDSYILSGCVPEGAKDQPHCKR